MPSIFAKHPKSTQLTVHITGNPVEILVYSPLELIKAGGFPFICDERVENVAVDRNNLYRRGVNNIDKKKYHCKNIMTTIRFMFYDFTVRLLFCTGF